MFRLTIMLSALVAAGFCPAATRAFTLPPGVRVAATDANGGWQASGTIRLAFAQAQARLATSIVASGWTHVHTISLNDVRTLDTWRRGREELTVMMWRISTAMSGFSYGVSATSGSAVHTTSGRKL